MCAPLYIESTYRHVPDRAKHHQRRWERGIAEARHGKSRIYVGGAICLVIVIPLIVTQSVQILCIVLKIR